MQGCTDRFGNALDLGETDGAGPRINLQEDYEVQYWTNALGVSEPKPLDLLIMLNK